MNRRELLKLLGGAVAAGLLPKVPLVSASEPPLTATGAIIKAQYEAHMQRIVLGWSNYFHRFIFLDEIDVVYAKRTVPLGNGTADILETNMGDLVVRGVCQIPVAFHKSHVHRLFSEVKVDNVI